ncbi:MAG TPA: polysaccharide deacetylase [Chloroflexota bacterium]|nr:polysaccharide deacetylase [Chloroflexota bacterium]
MPAYEQHQPVFPGGARCAACLTFDFDAESGWLSRDPSVKDRPGVISQGVYGARVAVPRILELLDAEQLRATFFIPGWVAERHPKPSEMIRDAGHEIGHHGYLHERNRPEDPDQERWNFARGIEALREVLDVRPLGYRSPGWDLTPITLDLVRDAGMLYSSNLMDDAWPYVHPGTSVVELPVQWSVDDAPFFMFHPTYANRTIQIPELVYGAFRDELAAVHEWGGLFNLTMHPQVSGHPARLNELRGLMRALKSMDGVWIATCEEIARFWLETGSKLAR